MKTFRDLISVWMYRHCLVLGLYLEAVCLSSRVKAGLEIEEKLPEEALPPGTSGEDLVKLWKHL